MIIGLCYYSAGVLRTLLRASKPVVIPSAARNPHFCLHKPLTRLKSADHSPSARDDSWFRSPGMYVIPVTPIGTRNKRFCAAERLAPVPVRRSPNQRGGYHSVI